MAIAVALVNDPSLILADEPTGNLDSKNAERVADLLVSLAKENEKTVIIATHEDKVAAKTFKTFKTFHMEDGQFVN